MLKKSLLIPIILLLYLVFMAWKGYPAYAAGEFSALYYFGLIAVTLGCIALLRLNLLRAERRRKERRSSGDSKPTGSSRKDR